MSHTCWSPATIRVHHITLSRVSQVEQLLPVSFSLALALSLPLPSIEMYTQHNSMACLSVSETSRVLLYSPLFIAKPVLSHGQGYLCNCDCECYCFSSFATDALSLSPLLLLVLLVIHSPVSRVNVRFSFLPFHSLTCTCNGILLTHFSL